MSKSFSNYALGLLIISVAYAALAWLILTRMLPEFGPIFQAVQLILILFLILGLASGFALFRYAKKRPGLLIRAFMASTVIKFVLYLVILVFFALRFRDYVWAITASFFIFYVTFAILEKRNLFKAATGKNN